MDYQPQDEPMGSDDAGASTMTRISELVTSLQAQLDELKSLMPEASAKPEEDGVPADDTAQTADEDTADAAVSDGSSMPKELLMKAMSGIK